MVLDDDFEVLVVLLLEGGEDQAMLHYRQFHFSACDLAGGGGGKTVIHEVAIYLNISVVATELDVSEVELQIKIIFVIFFRSFGCRVHRGQMEAFQGLYLFRYIFTESRFQPFRHRKTWRIFLNRLTGFFQAAPVLV